MTEMWFAFRTIVVLMMIYGTLRKLYVLHGNTRKWNGLGRAMRNEKWVYLLFWLWMFLTPFMDFYVTRIGFIVIGVALIITEFRVERTLPKVTVRNDTAR